MDSTGLTASTLVEGRLVIRRCAAEDVHVLELREPPSRQYARSTYSRQEAGLCLYLVAWLDTEPVGSGQLEMGSPPELQNLHVVPSWRGRGIGTAIMSEAEAAASGCGSIRIGVADDNAAAARLYTRLGYSPTGDSCTYSYEYVGDDGVSHEAVETSRYLEKNLPLHE